MKNYQYIEIFSIAVIGVLFASVGIKSVFIAALLSGCVQLGSTILLRKVFNSKIKLSTNVNFDINSLQLILGIIQFVIFCYLVYLLINGHLIDIFIDNISTYEGKLTDKDTDTPIFSIKHIKIGFQIMLGILSAIILYISIKNFTKNKKQLK